MPVLRMAVAVVLITVVVAVVYACTHQPTPDLSTVQLPTL